MKDFFEFIYGEGHGVACITLNDDAGTPNRDKFFDYPEQVDEMVEFCQTHSDETVYYTPSLMRAHNRKKPSVRFLQVVFGDADTMDLGDLLVEPSAVVTTSPGHTHVYWSVDNETDPLEIEQLNRSLSQRHDRKESGYDTGWAANKLLRVPGTMNLKYGEPFRVEIEYTGNVYSWEGIAAEYPKVDTLSAQYRDLPTDLPSRIDAMRSITDFSEDIRSLISTDFSKGYGSDGLWAAINGLFRAGANDEETFVLLQNAAVNKWMRNNIADADVRLWEDIIRARAKSDVLTEESLRAPSKALVAPKKPHQEVFDFLYDEEHDLLTPNFVTEFTAWSSSKTRSPDCFKVSGAFSILSAVFGDYGHIPFKWGDEPLNLWFMNLGRSTVDRKTTVKRHMTSFLGKLSSDEFTYNISSNMTVEGLASYMLDRPNRSGLVTRDEFQGFLAELSKNYMSGAKDALTDYYMGNINGKLRATGDNKVQKDVKFALSFYAMGIRAQVARALTLEDFRSGFLTRFIWVTPSEDASLDMDINDGFELAPRQIQEHGDEQLREMLTEIANARDFFDSFVDKEANTLPIRPTDEAFERLRLLRSDMSRTITALGKAELQSSTERMSQSVLRAAALLAMSKMQESVELADVVQVIAYAGDWFRNSIRMIDMVGESDWATRLDDILDALISEGGVATSKALYSHFKAEYKPRDYGEMLTALQESGTIEIIPTKKGRMIQLAGDR